MKESTSCSAPSIIDASPSPSLSTSRRPSVLTATAIIVATDTIRPDCLTFT
jgi:hypothetical protein